MSTNQSASVSRLGRVFFVLLQTFVLLVVLASSASAATTYFASRYSLNTRIKAPPSLNLQDKSDVFPNMAPSSHAEGVSIRVEGAGEAVAAISGIVGADLSGIVTGSAAGDWVFAGETNDASSGFQMVFELDTPMRLTLAGALTGFNGGLARASLSLPGMPGQDLLRLLRTDQSPAGGQFSETFLLKPGIRYAISADAFAARSNTRRRPVSASFAIDFDFTPVPEPGTATLLLIGLVGLGVRARTSSMHHHAGRSADECGKTAG